MSPTRDRVVALSKATSPLLVGQGQPTRVNALIGISSPSNEVDEFSKIEALQQLGNDGPDIVTDLSIVRRPPGRRLWERTVANTPFVAATVPIYLTHCVDGKIDPNELLDIATEQMESGVGLITIHPTATEELIELSKRRLIPCTSRGGALIIGDILARQKSFTNVYLEIMDNLISVASRTGTVISLGTTFRPACIFDALDHVHKREILIQGELGERIKAKGVGTIVEGPGHCRPRDIRRVATMLRKTEMPVMALGPLPLDSAADQDHIAGAIGATLLGLEGCASILSPVTREEHTGGVPNADSILEAVKTARIVARIIDLEILCDEQREHEINKMRAVSRSCVAGKSSPGCSRCASECPLTLEDLAARLRDRTARESRR